MRQPKGRILKDKIFSLLTIKENKVSNVEFKPSLETDSPLLQLGPEYKVLV